MWKLVHLVVIAAVATLGLAQYQSVRPHGHKAHDSGEATRDSDGQTAYCPVAFTAGHQFVCWKPCNALLSCREHMGLLTQQHPICSLYTNNALRAMSNAYRCSPSTSNI